MVFQIHYTPIGVEKVDCSSVAMIRAKEPAKRAAMTHGIPQRQFEIPPGDGNHAVRSSLTLPRGIDLLSLFPHMHLRGKSFQYTVHYPDGKSEVLLSVPAYDFGWQSVYRRLVRSPVRAMRSKPCRGACFRFWPHPSASASASRWRLARVRSVRAHCRSKRFQAPV